MKLRIFRRLAIGKTIIGIMLFYLAISTTLNAESKDTLFDVISSHPDLTEFSKYIKSGYLKNILTDDGEYTVFAPSNSAYESLPKRVQEMWENKTVKQWRVRLNLSHIADEYIEAPVTYREIEATSLNGNILIILNDKDDELSVNNARIIEKNLPANNGILHIIDSFIVP